MPELPEVETIRRQLIPLLRNNTINSIEVFHDKTVDFDETIEERLVGQTFQDIDRVGKLLIFSFYNKDDLFLLIHLKMTGQLLYVEDSRLITGGGHSISNKDISSLPNSHTRLSFTLQNNTTLYFNDMRLFGYAKLTNREKLEQIKLKFGPEPIDSNFDLDWFFKTLKKRKTSIKATLLDQSFVAGLGNIYVDELLFRSNILPDRRSDTITHTQAIQLAKNAHAVLQESIEVGGTTFQNFVDTNGNSGNFTQYLQVFNRNNLPCLVCGELIKKTKVAGRGTHFCPQCQK